MLCRAKKDVVLPEYHFVDHRIEILRHDKDYNNVVVYEHAVARPESSTLPSKNKWKAQRKAKPTARSKKSVFDFFRFND